MRTTTIVLALLLGVGIAPAGAQTTILNEPLQLTSAEQTIVYRTIIREHVAPAPRATVTRRDVRPSAVRPQQNVRTARPTVRTTTHERIVTTPRQQTVAVPMRERVVTTPQQVIVDDAFVPLSADQRRVVYRSIIQQPQSNIVVTQPVAPAPVITQRPLVVTERDPIVRTAPDVRERVIAPSPFTTGMARFLYAIEDDRVFLVDPTDSVVVAELQ